MLVKKITAEKGRNYFAVSFSWEVVIIEKLRGKEKSRGISQD